MDEMCLNEGKRKFGLHSPERWQENLSSET